MGLELEYFSNTEASGCLKMLNGIFSVRVVSIQFRNILVWCKFKDDDRLIP